MRSDRSIEDYIEAVASSAPAPGGGSVVGVVGALSAALGQMVLNFTENADSSPGNRRDELLRALQACQSRLMQSADDDETAYAPSAYLPAPDADPAVAVENAEWDQDLSDRVTAAMAQLDERSQAILRARWTGEQKATLQDLANEYGISAERVRQIEANAIKKLRKLVSAVEAAP